MVLPRRKDPLTLADSQVPDLDMATSRLENPATVHAVWTPRHCGPREAAKAAPAESCSDRSHERRERRGKGGRTLAEFPSRHGSSAPDYVKRGVEGKMARKRRGGEQWMRWNDLERRYSSLDCSSEWI